MRDKTKQPNFFILGAPKCGTTALWEYLSTHPAVFMCDPKEPHYFNFDQAYRGIGGRRGEAFSWSEYLAFFENAAPQHSAIGEASVWYLSSRVAGAEILKRFPAARFIVMLRNPSEMFPSLHEQLVVSGREDITQPEFAWRAQERRRAGVDLPKNCIEPSHLQYAESCALGSLLARLLEQVPPDRVHCILFDDLREDPRRVYTGVLRFLELPDDGRSAFPKVNAAKRLRSRLLQRFVGGAAAVKQRLGGLPSLGLLRRIDALNIHYRPRSPLDPSLHDELADCFESEVRLIEEITGRDLSHWYRGRRSDRHSQESEGAGRP